MSVSRIRLDFQRSGGNARLVGPSLLAAGLVACATLYFFYRQTTNEIAGLELQLGNLQSEARAGNARTRRSPPHARPSKNLATPWGRLLDDLEAASRDLDPSVALLEIQPDHENGKIRVLAETRSLVAALGYLERLQKSGTLVNPVLQSHEVRSEVAERPVRVEIVADWRAKS